MWKLLSPVLILVLTVNCYSKDIEIRDGWFYVDGERFFIKGIGYEAGARPYRLPGKRKFEKGLREYDFKLIKEAGINTLRCWAPMTEEELKLANDYGLMVIQGIGIDWRRCFISTY